MQHHVAAAVTARPPASSLAARACAEVFSKDCADKLPDMRRRAMQPDPGS